jgi:pSer/pThr/pTyr-binding forkhead associated (FHA) protein
MQVVIGRLSTNSLALDDPEVSGTHLILRWLEPDDGSPCCWQV